MEPIPRRVPLKHSNASKVKQAALIAVVVIGFAAAAFYAGVTVGGTDVASFVEALLGQDVPPT